MVRIRLARSGSKKRPFYHVVVTDSRNPRDGYFVERIGYFNPVRFNLTNNIKIKTDRFQYWLSQGAKPSNRVRCLMKSVDLLQLK